MVQGQNKKFQLFLCLSLVVGSTKIVGNVLQICDGRAFQHKPACRQVLMRRTEFSLTTKLFTEHETHPIANAFLEAVLLYGVFSTVSLASPKVVSSVFQR